MDRNFVLAAFLAAAIGWAEPAPGRWDGTVVYGKLKVPFTIQLDGGAAAMAGTLVNGDARLRSAAGSFSGDRLVLEFGSPEKRLDAKLADGELKGTFGAHSVTAAPYCTCGMEGVAGPAIMGNWDAPETGWRLAVTRKGEDTLVILTRAGQEFGPLNGRFDGLGFQLHYFDGERAALMEIEERKDGRLDVEWTEPGKDPVKVVTARAISPDRK